MKTILSHLKRNWKRYALAAAIAGAGYYGGPAASQAVKDYLPALYHGIVGSASGAETVKEMPQVPADVPLVLDRTLACPSGGLVYLHVYDKAPGDLAASAFVVYGIATIEDGKEVHQLPFLILYGTSDNYVAWLRLPGRSIQKLVTSELRSRYSHPCEILDQIKASPA